MTYLLSINVAVLFFLAMVWRTHNASNFVLKGALILLWIGNSVALAMTLGYVVRL